MWLGMNVTVYQCISVNNLSIGTISNSSVLQIGTSGRIHTLSNNYQSEQASDAPPPTSTSSPSTSDAPLVPLPAPAELYTGQN